MAGWNETRWLKLPEEEIREKGIYAGDLGGRFAYFRCEAALPKGCSLHALITANSRYRLFVNGQAVLSGPCKGDLHRQYYEEVALDEYLIEGKNVFAAQVLYNDPYIAEEQTDERAAIYGVISPTAGHRFAFSGKCLDESGQTVADLSTGSAVWRVYLENSFYLKSTEITQYLGAVIEEIDFNEAPVHWKEASEDVSSWRIAEPAAYVDLPGPLSVAGVRGHFRIRKREIPLLYEREEQFDRAFVLKEGKSGREKGPCGQEIRVKPGETVTLIFDSGVIKNGYPKYSFSGGKGAEIQFTYFEKFGGPGSDFRRDDWEHGEIIGLTDRIILPGGSTVYEPFWYRCFRFVRVCISCREEALAMQAPSFRKTGYPLSPTRSYAGQDPKLQALYEISLRTLENCMMETYMDCPYYEQLQFAMDTRLEALYTYAVGGDTRLAKKALLDFHYGMLPEGLTPGKYPSAYLQVLSTFSLHYIYMMAEYLEETKDLALIREIACDADRILDYYDRKIGAYGLVGRLTPWEFVDWQEDWAVLAGTPRALLYGPSTIINLMFLYALLDAEKLMNALGRTGLASEYRTRREKLCARIMECCYDAEKGLFREGPAFRQYTCHAQAWAVLCGLFEGEEAKALLRRARADESVLKCSFSTAFEWFRALELTGMKAEIMEELSDWTALLDLHCSCCPETPKGARSDCHAWSALPLYVLSKA